MSETVVIERAGSRRKRRSPAVGVLGVALTWMSVWWLVIGLLVAPVVPGGALTVLALAVVSALPVAVLASGFTGRSYPSAAMRLYVLRPFWYIQLSLPLAALAGLSGVVLGLPFGAAGTAGRWALLIATSVFAIIAIAGYIGSRSLRVKPIDTAFADLPADLDGLKIAQISDLHVGPHTSRRHLARIVNAVMAARPDIIAITGDQVDDYGEDVAHFAKAFGGLRAPLGVFAIAGNHDVYAGWHRVQQGMEGVGMHVLVNEAVELIKGKSRFWIAGTGDPAGSGWSRGGGRDVIPDVARTLGRIPDNAFAIVLAHNPVLWPALAEKGVQLTLSGHTHHGQFSIPWLGWSVASPFLEHAMGSHERNGSKLYINPGTNYWGLPLRIGAHPEVTVVTLRRT